MVVTVAVVVAAVMKTVMTVIIVSVEMMLGLLCWER